MDAILEAEHLKFLNITMSALPYNKMGASVGAGGTKEHPSGDPQIEYDVLERMSVNRDGIPEHRRVKTSSRHAFMCNNE